MSSSHRSRPFRLLARATLTALMAAAALATSLASDDPSPLYAQQQDQQEQSGRPRRCSSFAQPDPAGRFLDDADRHPPQTVQGDDLLAVVDRSPGGALPSSYSPHDLLDLDTMQPISAHLCVPPRHQCLRREAAQAYRRMARAARSDGHRLSVVSAYRGYSVQCAVFHGWAYRDGNGFCQAAEFSALPGHSQHQLGTTIDVFTSRWTHDGPRFRPGFGCSPGGRWLAAHAHEHGFILSYPLHPDLRAQGSDCAPIQGGEDRVDPRTGYKHEPWHFRYVGMDAARRFMAARQASGVGTHTEIAFDEWLRAERGRSPVHAPVCDGCSCEGCATFAAPGSQGGPCRRAALHLDRSGAPLSPSRPPELTGLAVERRGDGALLVRARVRVQTDTLTQAPVVTRLSHARYRRGEDGVELPPLAGRRAFPMIEGTFRLGIGVGEGNELPLVAALVRPRIDGTENGGHAPFPASPGSYEIVVPIEEVPAGSEIRAAIVGPTPGEPRSARAP